MMMMIWIIPANSEIIQFQSIWRAEENAFTYNVQFPTNIRYFFGFFLLPNLLFFYMASTLERQKTYKLKKRNTMCRMHLIIIISSIKNSLVAGIEWSFVNLFSVCVHICNIFRKNRNLFRVTLCMLPWQHEKKPTLLCLNQACTPLVFNPTTVNCHITWNWVHDQNKLQTKLYSAPIKICQHHRRQRHAMHFQRN